MSLAIRHRRDGAGEIPKGLRRQLREAGNDGEGDRAEAHGEMRALADLIEQPRGEDAGEEHDPEQRLHGREPSAEQAADANAERDARRGAEAGDERAFGIGQREQEPGDAADQPRAGLTAQHADHHGRADADEGERAAAEVERQKLRDGVGGPHQTGAGWLRALRQIGGRCDVVHRVRNSRRLAAVPLAETPSLVAVPGLLFSVPTMNRRCCGCRTIKRVKRAGLGNAAAMMHDLRIVDARGTQERHAHDHQDRPHPTLPR